MWLSEQTISHILKEEVRLHFSKAHGHGGQKINKKRTKAELYFSIGGSHYLTQEEKQSLIDLWWNHVHHHSQVLILTCQEERYQKANKEKVMKHFVSLLAKIL